VSWLRSPGFCGVVAACTSGLAEYLITDGTSTYVPLVSGLAGASFGLVYGWIAPRLVPSPLASDYTVAELQRSVANTTTLEREAKSKIYKGELITVHGRVTDIKKDGPDSIVLDTLYGMSLSWVFFTLYRVSIDVQDGGSVSALFSPAWNRKIRSITSDYKVVVRGKVRSVYKNVVFLSSCDLIEVRPPEVEAEHDDD